MKLKTPDPAAKSGPVKTFAPLDRRYAERAPTNCRVVYTGADGARIVQVEGALQDLSKTGCKILGKTQPVMGGDLTIQFYIEDGGAPLCVTGGQVTWVKGLSFAIRFPRLTPEERRRVQEVIWRNVKLSSATHNRTAFRIT
ncbi:MAG TPA: PilZ domain-containing protein [Nitrospiraceae bacterium]|nr:PilZ domain-containing protein [Nitrospiraceae bacterium]